jgi:Glycosyl hydrolases family 18
LLQLANALGVDGIDMDYEAATVNNDANVAQYSNVLTILHNTAKAMNGLNAAGKSNPKLFTMAVSGVGADCAPENSSDPYCQTLHLNSAWSGSGVERRVLKANNLAKWLDMVNIMTFDAGFYAYDPVLAYKQYRGLLPAGVPVNVGLEVLFSSVIGGPLGPEQSKLMVNDADVDAIACPGTVMLNDQYSTIWNNPAVLRPVNRPYSVQNLATSVNNFNKATATKDGLMMWSLFRIESENLNPNAVTCNGVIAATPESARIRAAQIMKWPIDTMNVD